MGRIGVVMDAFWKNDLISLYNCDGRKTSFINDNSVDLIITSPPYYRCNHLWGNLWRKLNIENFNDYNEWMQLFYNEWYRILGNGRYVIVNTSHINDETDDKEKIAFNNPAYTAIGLERAGFEFADNIIWKKTRVCSPRFGTLVTKRFPRFYYPNNVYEVWLVYRKGQISHDESKQTEDVVILDFDRIKDDCRNDIWEFETESSAKVHHVAPFPASITSRFISLYSYPGEVVFDPFAGTGTVGYAASRLKRKSILVDIDTNFCDYMKDRFINNEGIF